MLDLKAWIAKVTDYVANDTYIVEDKTVSFSFSSQRYKNVTADVSKTGYTPVGIVGYRFAQIDWLLSECRVVGTTLALMIFRTSSTTASSTVTFSILYRKVGGVVRKLLNTLKTLTSERRWVTC